MTQQPFSRPGAVDLSGLQASNAPAGAAAGTPGGGAPGGGAPYALAVTEQNFQDVLEASRNAPVLLAFESPERSPESTRLADDVQTLSTELA